MKEEYRYNILPSPRKHNEFSFEDQVITYWMDGYRVAELQVLTGEFIDHTDGMSEQDGDDIFNSMIEFYNTL